MNLYERKQDLDAAIDELRGSSITIAALEHVLGVGVKGYDQALAGGDSPAGGPPYRVSGVNLELALGGEQRKRMSRSCGHADSGGHVERAIAEWIHRNLDVVLAGALEMSAEQQRGHRRRLARKLVGFQAAVHDQEVD